MRGSHWARSKACKGLFPLFYLQPSAGNRRKIVVVVIVSGAYTGFVEPRISVTAWMQERPHAHIRDAHYGVIVLSP